MGIPRNTGERFILILVKEKVLDMGKATQDLRNEHEAILNVLEILTTAKIWNRIGFFSKNLRG
jgi:hypothetical protein